MTDRVKEYQKAYQAEYKASGRKAKRQQAYYLRNRERILSRMWEKRHNGLSAT